MSATEGQLALYNERQIIAVPGAELDQVQSGEVVRSEDPYLASDVYQNSFGVASFALGIPHPSQRPVVYEGEGTAGPYHGDGEDHPSPSISGDPVKRAHFYNTDRGFAIVRTIIAPTEVTTALHEDKFLGPAVIDKCCLEETVPSDLDEQTMQTGLLEPASWLALPGARDWDHIEGINPYTDRIRQRLQAATGSEYELLREYPSWHSYRVYREVLEQIIRGCKATVANFDEVLSLLSKGTPKLHDFKGQSIEVGKVALLPEGKSEPQ
ncbi:MAG TPA: hypothetical protein VFX79_00750 [Candidatus Saccharimonadales bacterium]|nr:hypothetical protein [Candidatus Saccharimonadales bacterium]